jgi:membrane-bound ClpP family serine protease
VKVRGIAGIIGIASMIIGLFCAAIGLLLCAVDDRGRDVASAIQFAFALTAILMAAGFALWSTASRIRPRLAAPVSRGR